MKLFSIKAQLWLGFFVLLLISGCQKSPKTISITGNTMGTTYSIKFVENSSNKIDSTILKNKIDSTLQVINSQMSTYIIDSEICQFNRIESNDWFSISPHFFTVLKSAMGVSKLTDGAFDFTVGPLMELWGFNNFNQDSWQPPSKSQINAILPTIGFENIELKDNTVRKLNPNIQIDVNAIAKGYGVDVVFELLKSLGYVSILVEIGGEVRCLGTNHKGEVWKIGIDKPLLDIIPGTELHTIISLDNNALATSGDYRNYIEFDGEIYSHTINPITGFPTQYQVASASVSAPSCIFADALATALMIKGESGIDLIDSLENVEAMIILRTTENDLIYVVSEGWKGKVI